MVKLKDILFAREMDLLEHYQSAMLNIDLEDTESLLMYQTLISDMIQNAKGRYYEENPSIIPLKKEGSNKEKANNNTIKVRDLFTKEEAEEVEFLKWRRTRSIFPWLRKRDERKIEEIIAEAKNRNGY